VVAITSGTADMQVTLDALWQHLLPGLNDEPVPADPDGRAALAARLAALRFDPPPGEPVTATARRLSGRTVAFEPNRYGVESAVLVAGDAADEVTLRFAGGAGAALAHHAEPAEQQLRVPSRRPSDVPVPTVAALVSGTWTGPDRYVLTARLVETPFVWTLTVDVDGDTVLVSPAVNVAFGPTAPEPFAGKVQA
jgi:hypothetical protein